MVHIPNLFSLKLKTHKYEYPADIAEFTPEQIRSINPKDVGYYLVDDPSYKSKEVLTPPRYSALKELLRRKKEMEGMNDEEKKAYLKSFKKKTPKKSKKNNQQQPEINVMRENINENNNNYKPVSMTRVDSKEQEIREQPDYKPDVTNMGNVNPELEYNVKMDINEAQNNYDSPKIEENRLMGGRANRRTIKKRKRKNSRRNLIGCGKKSFRKHKDSILLYKKSRKLRRKRRN